MDFTPRLELEAPVDGAYGQASASVHVEEEWHLWNLHVAAAWHDFMLAQMATAWLPPPPVDAPMGLEQGASSPLSPPMMSPCLDAAAVLDLPVDVQPFSLGEAITLSTVGVCMESFDDGSQHIYWTANARLLSSLDKSAVSPEFKIRIPLLGLQPFRIVLHAAASGAGRGGSSFRRARGRGRIEVTCKCKTGLRDTMPRLAVCFSVGEKEHAQPFRGPVLHSFADQSVCSLPQEEETFDFAKTVQEGKTFVVRISVVAASS